MSPKPSEETMASGKGHVTGSRFGNGKRPLDLVTRESLVTCKGAVSGDRERGHNAVE